MVSLMEITRARIREAADVLAEAMLDDGFGRYLAPDPDERLTINRAYYAELIGLAISEGRVDAWGDPIVGVAVWLERPAVTDGEHRSTLTPAAFDAPALLAPDVAARVERFGAVLRQLRERARPDRHAYLDSIGVLPDHRRRGIATRLLAAGHAWADGAGLPCALDTVTDENVEFYQRRGYRIVSVAPVPGSGLCITAMRRPEVGPDLGSEPTFDLRARH
jgi:ribosomal protein S18 acetylase RimI-like enzyme